MADTPSETPVLIAGGGPIGLALAADLGRRGVATLLVEERENKLNPAKMLEVSVRTMEFCRQLGIVEKVRNWGFPADWSLDSVFVTDLQGYELGRVRVPALEEQTHLPVSPERGMPCPQTWFDPILQEHARSFPHVTLRHRTKLESFVQDSDHVTATLRDEQSGRAETVRARYLVGCDGFASTVRELLGIEIRGEPHIDWSMTIYLRIPDLQPSTIRESVPLCLRRARGNVVVSFDRRRQGFVAAPAGRSRRRPIAECRHPRAHAPLHGPRYRLYGRGQEPLGAEVHGG